MTVIALSGTKGSPGTTTLALAICASDKLAPLLIEADAAGGDIAARCGMALDPGLLTLAASGRRGLDRSTIEHHAQPHPSGVLALLAPTSAGQAASALTGIAATLARTLANDRSSVIVDTGRWDPRSPALDLVASASVAVLVLRPTIEGVEHARWQLANLQEIVPRVVVATVGGRPYPPAEVRSALAVDELYVIDDDTRAANALGSGARSDRWLRRSQLIRSAGALAKHLIGEQQHVAVPQ
jgi:MinD-like ATPase involved in chromosome partitioning or flagellar assembly